MTVFPSPVTRRPVVSPHLTCPPPSSVTQRTGLPFRSRPYRLRAHNGCYVGMETDWSCFVNPWSNRIEAVICKHRVIKVGTR